VHVAAAVAGIKVLQVLPTLCAGGAEGFVANLCVSLADQGAETRVFLLAGVRGTRGLVLQKRLEQAGVRIVGIEARSIRSPSTLLRLSRLIRSWAPDIVQANLFAGEIACVAARVLALRPRVRYARRLANTMQSHLRADVVVRFLDRSFHLVIANSPAVASAYSEFTRGHGDTRLVTIPNGGHLLSSVPTSDEKQRARDVLGVPRHVYVVAHIGSMFPGRTLGRGLETAQKAHDVLLRAFSEAFGAGSKALLLSVGDGPLRKDIEELAQRLELQARVKFLGELPEPWPVLKAADVFFFPSRYEGLPNVLPEAASCGLPVIASDIPEIRGIFEEGVWTLEPPDDVGRFAHALRDGWERRDELARRASAAAPEFRERFSMERCAERYLQAYQAVLWS